MEYNVRAYDYPDSLNVTFYSKSHKKGIKAPEWLKKKKSNELNPEYFVPQEELDYKKKHSIYVSLTKTKNTVYNIVRSNIWDFFVTLTFSQNDFPSDDITFCSQAFTNFASTVKRIDTNLGYIFIPELHKDRKHIHFHGLVVLSPDIPLSLLGIVDSGHTFRGNTLYNWEKWEYGFSNVSHVESQQRVSRYILKYLSKDNAIIMAEKKRYYATRNLNRIEAEYGLYEQDFEESFIANCNNITSLQRRVNKHTNEQITYIEVSKI